MVWCTQFVNILDRRRVLACDDVQPSGKVPGSSIFTAGSRFFRSYGTFQQNKRRRILEYQNENLIFQKEDDSSVKTVTTPASAGWVRTVSTPVRVAVVSKSDFTILILEIYGQGTLKFCCISHQPLGMRMYKVRGDTFHCFRVEIPACVNRLPPQLALSLVTAVDLKCVFCIGEVN